ncbi:MarR family transcriptional regulator [Tersicoccus sp. MR15.9]|uniref:MarR family winged helix-turn-helix transcriptional regulator n=1 Tax=Tersicoccus mangrovi TaxID=3121635 RepID=UPI002FE5C96B
MPEPSLWPTSRLLSTAARLVEHSWNENLASIGVTHAGVIALDVLATYGPMTQARLASLVKVQAQTMGKTLHRLQIHGHVSRQRDEQDRRSHVVTITDAGRTALERSRRIERDLLPGGDRTSDELRGQLVDIIASLGDARWQNSGMLPDDEDLTSVSGS